MALNMSDIQKVGRSFMLPIALLPAAGILLGVGGALSNPETLATYPALDISWLQHFFQLITAAGGVVFGNLPLLFALAIPIGMAKGEAGAAALAGAIAFLIMHATIGQLLSINGVDWAHVNFSAEGYDTQVGIHTLQMGVFGGIVAGSGAVWIHNRTYKTELHHYIGFFSGVRFVPIVTAFVFIFVGIAMTFVWPVVQAIIASLGSLVSSSGYAGTFIYGVIERALIPFGLHHIFYLPFWQTALGGQMDVCGELITGAQNIFFKQLACTGVTHFEVEHGTRFMAGKFPFMIFGLPAAAVAMWHTARPENKETVAALVFSAAGTAFLTGITEPIEFTFLFVAPFLYGIHCLLAGLSFMLMHMLNVGVGMTFSGGFIDLFLFGILQGTAKTSWYWIPIVGAGYSVIYYFLFRTLILAKDLKTPGREEGVNAEDIKLYKRDDYNAQKDGGSAPAGGKPAGSAAAKYEQAADLIAALGGLENIGGVDACITRLRLTIKDMSKMADDSVFKGYGAMGVVRMGETAVQLIYGGRAAVLKNEFIEIADEAGVKFE